MATVKNEVKEEHASPAPESSDDEDLYEDAGDLEFYEKKPNNENLYSARLPQYLWKKWAALVERMGDDEEIQLGTLRTWNEPDSSGKQVVSGLAPNELAQALTVV